MEGREERGRKEGKGTRFHIRTFFPYFQSDFEGIVTLCTTIEGHA